MSLRIPVVATGQSCPGAAPAANCVLAGDSAETQAWLSEAPGPQADRGLDGWMASPTQWTGVWVDSGSW